MSDITSKFSAGWSIFMLAFLVWWPAVTPAQQDLSLQGCIHTALLQNPGIRASQLESLKAALDQKRLVANWLPQLSAEGQLQYFFSLPTQLIPAAAFNPLAPEGTYLTAQFGVPYQGSANITATQVLFSKSLLIAGEVSREYKDLTFLQTMQQKEDLAANVAMVYCASIAAQRSVKVLDGTISLMKQLESLLQKNFQQGLIKQTDVQKVSVNISLLEAQKESALAQLHQQLTTLNFLMGQDLENKISLRDTLPFSSEINDLPGQNYFPSNRTQLMVLSKQENMLSLNKKVTNSGYFPTLAAFYSANAQLYGPKFSDIFSKDFTFGYSLIGISLKMNLFDGLSKHRDNQKTDVQIEQLKLQQQLVKEQIRTEVTNARNKLIAARSTYYAQELNLQNALKLYSLSIKEYQQGVTSLTDVVQSQLTCQDAQGQFIQAYASLLLAVVEYKKASGTLIPKI